MFTGEDQGGYLGSSVQKKANQAALTSAFDSASQPQQSTYNKGYAFTDDQTGDALAAGAKAGGSAATVLAGAVLGNRAIRKAKQQKRLIKEAQHKSYIDSMNASLLNQSEGDLAAERNRHDQDSELGSAGLGESSAKNVADRDADHANDLRTWALRKQRADLTYGYENGKKIQRLQEQIDRIQQQEATIGAAVDTVISVASIASDRAIKKDFVEVNPVYILDGLSKLPIKAWTYENEKFGVKHIGPTAQDFKAMFGLGDDDTRIAVVDGIGVALVAIKELTRQVALQNNQIRKLEAALKVKNAR